MTVSSLGLNKAEIVYLENGRFEFYCKKRPIIETSHYCGCGKLEQLVTF